MPTAPDDQVERFRALALPHLDAIYTAARHLLGNAFDADDATQECFLRAFRHFDSYRGPEIRPWLFTILRNVCCTARKASAETAGGDSDDGVMPLWGEAAETPEHAVLRRRDAESVRRLINALPVVFREVIVLREVEELSYREIADIVDAPIGTVMSRLARARTLLRAAWLDADREEAS